jgi:hypothetical protein
VYVTYSRWGINNEGSGPLPVIPVVWPDVVQTDGDESALCDRYH